MSNELQELRNVFHGLETLYSTYLPKVDPVLLNDLLLHEEEKSERSPFYMVEVFTKPGTNSEWCKQHIIETVQELVILLLSIKDLHDSQLSLKPDKYSIGDSG